MSNVSTVRLLLLKQKVGLKSAYIKQGTSLPLSTGKTTQAHLQTDVMKHHEPVVHGIALLVSWTVSQAAHAV